MLCESSEVWALKIYCAMKFQSLEDTAVYDVGISNRRSCPSLGACHEWAGCSFHPLPLVDHTTTGKCCLGFTG